MFCPVSPSVAAASLVTLGSVCAFVPGLVVPQGATDPLLAVATPQPVEGALGAGAVLAVEARLVPAAKPVLALGVPAPRGPLELAPGEPTLEDLIHEFEAAVGALVIKSDQVCSQAASERLTLAEILVVPPEEVYPFFENVLLQKGFYLSFLKGGAVPAFAVKSIHNSHSSTYSWHEIAVEDLPALEDHPALLVSCAIDLANADARQLSNSLRPASNSQTNLVMACSTNTIFLRGSGEFVGQLGRVALQTDAATPPPTPAETQGVQAGAGQRR